MLVSIVVLFSFNIATGVSVSQMHCEKYIRVALNGASVGLLVGGTGGFVVDSGDSI